MLVIWSSLRPIKSAPGSELSQRNYTVNLFLSDCHGLQTTAPRRGCTGCNGSTGSTGLREPFHKASAGADRTGVASYVASKREAWARRVAVEVSGAAVWKVTTAAASVGQPRLAHASSQSQGQVTLCLCLSQTPSLTAPRRPRFRLRSPGCGPSSWWSRASTGTPATAGCPGCCPAPDCCTSGCRAGAAGLWVGAAGPGCRSANRARCSAH